jgi:hypothetical protein
MRKAQQSSPAQPQSLIPPYMPPTQPSLSSATQTHQSTAGRVQPQRRPDFVASNAGLGPEPKTFFGGYQSFSVPANSSDDNSLQSHNLDAANKPMPNERASCLCGAQLPMRDW